MSGFGGGSPLFLEALFNNSEPHKGWRADYLVSPALADWKTTAGLTLTGATTPSITSVHTSIEAIQWAATAATTVVATYQFVMPEEWAENENDWQVIITGRKVDTNDTEAAGLKFRTQLFWFTPGDAALSTLSTPADSASIAAAAAAAVSTFANYTCDVGARLTAESKTINGGDTVKVVVGLSAVNGTTDLVTQAAGIGFRMRRHAALRTRADRGNF